MAARYWSEGDLVAFNNRQFRIASRIGSGSFGSTFKVVNCPCDIGEFGLWCESNFCRNQEFVGTQVESFDVN